MKTLKKKNYKKKKIFQQKNLQKKKGFPQKKMSITVFLMSRTSFLTLPTSFLTLPTSFLIVTSTLKETFFVCDEIYRVKMIMSISTVCRQGVTQS